MGRFDELKGKKILVYGTGRVAECVLDELKEFEVVGIIDRIRMEGTLKGISILTWDDLYVGMAEILSQNPILLQRVSPYSLRRERTKFIKRVPV